jgi:3-oxoacyl-[acyl-carrier-protein] synthase-3
MARCRLESIGVSKPRDTLFKMGSLQHAVVAGQAAFASSRCLPEDIDVLINTGVYRDKHYAEPAFACFIQKELDINVEFRGRQVLAFDVLNGGCGMLNGIDVVTTMMAAGAVEVAMVVASETNADKRPDPSYAYSSSGAALILDVSPISDEGFGNIVIRTFDQFWELNSSVVSLAQKNGQLLIRKDAELQRAYQESIPSVWQELLTQEGLQAEEVDLVLPSQVSPDFVGLLPELLGVKRERVVDISNTHGDTLTTSPFLAYAHAKEQGLVERGATIVFLAVGSGVTVGAGAYYC